MIFLRSFFSKLLKTTISSTLFKNSGEKAFFRDFSIVLLMFLASCDFIDSVPNPTPFPKSLTCLAPKLDVIIITVFLKSTFLPKLSVNEPSSNT